MGTALIGFAYDGRIVILSDVHNWGEKGPNGSEDGLSYWFEREDGSSIYFPSQAVVFAGYYPKGTEARMQADLKAVTAGAKKKK